MRCGVRSSVVQGGVPQGAGWRMYKQVLLLVLYCKIFSLYLTSRIRKCALPLDLSIPRFLVFMRLPRLLVSSVARSGAPQTPKLWIAHYSSQL